MASASQRYLITCLCGAARQEVDGIVSSPSQDGPEVIQMCHCDDCRHSTGLLCASYVAVAAPLSVNGLTSHISGDGGGGRTTRYFCRTCGCHIFKCTEGQGGKESWEVATGVIADAQRGQASAEQSAVLPRTEHVHVEDTKDGGLAPWMAPGAGFKPTPASPGQESEEEEVLPAECHCGNVKFHITRPDEASTHPRSQFPDLMIAYHAGSPVTPNPDDVKWWLRGGAGAGAGADEKKTRYLAGTCTCRSCRLISGFEVQTWTFVPRPNIVFRVPGGGDGGKSTTTLLPLDFGTLPRGVLQGYESSPGVVREFCPGCGATVFWHDKWRPDVIDVSVGLLRGEAAGGSGGGARAEGWLDWWKGRVSFIEDAGLDRTGWPARWAVKLGQGLEDGLKKEEGK